MGRKPQPKPENAIKWADVKYYSTNQPVTHVYLNFIIDTPKVPVLATPQVVANSLHGT